MGRMETSAMSTSRPLVERSRTDGIEMPARWSHAPSSKGTGSPGGRPAGSPSVALRSGDTCPKEPLSFIGSTRKAGPFFFRPPFAGVRRIDSSISSLQRHGHSVPAPNAQGREPVVHILLFHGVQQRDNDAIPRAANRMAQGDGAPADIEDLPRDAELLPHADTRRGECLIVLDQIELIELHPGPVHQFPHARDRREHHVLRLDGLGAEVSDRTERFHADFAVLALAHQHRLARSVGNYVRFACVEYTTLLYHWRDV